MFDFSFGKKTGKKKSRKKLTEHEKQKILERQGYRCAICGRLLKPGVIHFDHKKPLALGGSDNIRNIQALCPECHHIKTKEDRHKIAKAKNKSSSSFDLGINLPKLEPPKFNFDLGFNPVGGSSSSKSKKGKKKSTKSKRKKKDDFWSIW